MRITYQELKNRYQNSIIPYSELLQTSEWFEKRTIIIGLSNYKCNICRITETFYHEGVHLWFKITDDKKRLEEHSLNLEKERIAFNNLSIEEQEKKRANPLFGIINSWEDIDIEISPKPHYFHVHHTYYQKGKLPWEYPNEALLTLCWECHENLHQNQKIPYLDEQGVIVSNLNPCKRCFGAGVFPEYGHVQNGVCFRCNGMKYEDFLTS